MLLKEITPIKGFDSGVEPQGAWAALDKEISLPDAYGEDRLVLMPRDPYWMYAYWEIAPGLIEAVRSRYGSSIFQESQATLRVHDVTGLDYNGSNSRRSFDIAIFLEARRWYIQVSESGRTYLVEIGLRNARGEFILLLRSNPVTLPFGCVSDITDAEWMSAHFEKLVELSGWPRTGQGSAEFAKVMAQRWEFLRHVFSWAGSMPAASRALRAPQ